MGTCDVCNSSTSWEEGTAYTADEFRRIVRMGFEPPSHLIMFLPNGLSGWKNGLVANSTTGWLLCPSCARRAARYMPKPSGTGPGGHVMTELMTRDRMLGLSGGATPEERLLNEMMSAMLSDKPSASKPAGPKPAAPKPQAESKPAAPPPAEPALVAEKTKDCPTCGKKLKAAAEACPTCGAKFEVHTRAYCTHCHKLIHAGADGKCPDCSGSGLLDPRLYSKLAAAGTPPAKPASKTKKTGPAEVAPIPVPEAAPAEPAPTADTKKCPRCAETIKAEAKLCRFCGAKFEVAVKGYCLNCHAEVTPDENDRCLACGGGIVDRHIKSALAAEPAKIAVPAPGYARPAASTQRPGFVTFYAIMTWIWCAAVVIGGIVGGIAIISDSPDAAAGGVVFMFFCLGYAILLAFVGTGLWQLKNWARVTAIVLRAIWMGLYLISGLGVIFSGNIAGGLCGMAFWIGINSSMLNWFSQHKEYFS
jgi:hypothetical protein